MAALDIRNAGSCCFNLVWNLQYFTPDEFLKTFAAVTKGKYGPTKAPEIEKVLRHPGNDGHYSRFYYARTPFVVMCQTGDHELYGDNVVARIKELGLGEIMETPGRGNIFHSERMAARDKIIVWMPDYAAIQKWALEQEKAAAPLNAYDNALPAAA